MKTIGIPTMERNNENQYYVPEKYIQAIRHAGGRPILLPPGSIDPAGYCKLIDGLLLMGGGDIAPMRYGDENKNLAIQINDERDESEFKLLARAVERRIPILGVCRGMQLINVHFGGTLHQDLTASGFDQSLHSSTERTFVLHTVQAKAGTELANIIGNTPKSVQSLHHQCLSRLGDGLIASGFSPDGLVEAIEKPDYPWLLGVQWHPEQNANSETAHQGLFNHFIMACSKTDG